jgi:Na+/H+-translocating membrane pyrophosphatase
MKFCFLDNNIKKSIKRIITWSLVCILISIIEYFIDGSYSIGYLLGFIIIGSILILITSNKNEISFLLEHSFEKKKL